MLKRLINFFYKIKVFTNFFINHRSRVLVEGKIGYNVRKGEHGNIHFTNITAGKLCLFDLLQRIISSFFLFKITLYSLRVIV